jgi:hypothetical protein
VRALTLPWPLLFNAREIQDVRPSQVRQLARVKHCPPPAAHARQPRTASQSHRLCHHVRRQPALQRRRPECAGPQPSRECPALVGRVANAPDVWSRLLTAQLAHVHLVSSYRFPTLPSLRPEQAVEYLIKGPQIVRDTSPVAWTYFAAPPQDGSLILTWQPPRLGTHMASDGMVWADAETAYDMNTRGYVRSRPRSRHAVPP